MAPKIAAFGVLLSALWPLSLLWRARVRGRDALLSQAFADVLTHSSLWQAVECFAAHCAMLGFGGQMWPGCCQACVYDKVET